ncbi:hypothetical protein RUND412_001447 [Rhizina undulata]
MYLFPPAEYHLTLQGLALEAMYSKLPRKTAKRKAERVGPALLKTESNLKTPSKKTVSLPSPKSSKALTSSSAQPLPTSEASSNMFWAPREKRHVHFHIPGREQLHEACGLAARTGTIWTLSEEILSHTGLPSEGFGVSEHCLPSKGILIFILDLRIKIQFKPLRRMMKTSTKARERMSRRMMARKTT